MPPLRFIPPIPCHVTTGYTFARYDAYKYVDDILTDGSEEEIALVKRAVFFTLVAGPWDNATSVIYLDSRHDDALAFGLIEMKEGKSYRTRRPPTLERRQHPPLSLPLTAPFPIRRPHSPLYLPQQYWILGPFILPGSNISSPPSVLAHNSDDLASMLVWLPHIPQKWHITHISTPASKSAPQTIIYLPVGARIHRLISLAASFPEWAITIS